MARSNITIEHLFQRPDDGAIVTPSWEVPDGRTPVPRLAWSTQRPATVDESVLTKEFVKNATADAQFVLDTSFVTGAELPRAFWDQLLGKQILIAPLVRLELEPWANNPHRNVYFHVEYMKSLIGPHGSIRHLCPLSLDDPFDRGLMFYIRLLAFRKEVMQVMREQLESSPDSSPKDCDVLRRTQQLVKSRGLVLAKKGDENRHKANWLADEATVVRSVSEGVRTGRETSILTRDNDLAEQFYKFIFLIDTDYRSMLLAAKYASQPLNFIQRAVPKELSPGFETDSSQLLHMPCGADFEVLPNPHDWVMLYANVFGGTTPTIKLAQLAYCADQGFKDVFDMKGKTGGRNTNLFGTMNFRRGVHPGMTDLFGAFCILCNERNVHEIDGLHWTVTDVEYAICTNERGRQVVYADIE